MPAPASNQRIDGRRLWDSLMAMAEVGATPKGGVKRLALSEGGQGRPGGFPRLVRGRRARRAHRRDGQHVRPPRGP